MLDDKSHSTTGRNRRTPGGRVWVWPALVFVVVSSLVLIAWRHESWQVGYDLQRHTAIAQTQLARRIEKTFKDFSRPLSRLSTEWVEGDLAVEKFAGDAASVRRRIQTFVRLTLFDADDNPLASWEADERQPDKSDDALMRKGLQESRRLASIVAIENDAPNAPCVLLTCPAIVSGQYRGAVVAIIEVEAALADTLDPHTLNDFQINLGNGTARPLAKLGEAAESADDIPAERILIYNMPWELRLKPTAQLMSVEKNNHPIWVLCGGLLIAAVVSTALAQFLLGRRREQLHTTSQVRSLETLNDISLALGKRVSAGTQILADVAEAAQRGLGASMSCVGLLENEDTQLRFVAFRNFDGERGDVVVSTSETPGTLHIIRTLEPLMVNDIEHADYPLNREQFRKEGIVAVALSPMVVDGRGIGVLVIGERSRREWSGADFTMARLLSAQAAVAVANMRLYAEKDAALAANQRLLGQREQLQLLNETIYASPDLREALQAIADSAPEILGVDFCCISLVVEEDPRQVEVAAYTRPPTPSNVGNRFFLDEASRLALSSRTARVIVDAHDDPSVHESFRAFRQLGTLAYVPFFRSDGSPMGILAVLRFEPTGLAREQLDLAQFLATRTAVAIENARLHHQARRDSETKAMLLRELNHRVKNTLAGIVTLLNLEAPALSEEAQAWLDGIVGRIRVIARAHEMFVGGLTRVPVEQLVRGTLESLEMLKPPGLEIRTSFDGSRVTLQPERAVALAMVLYELCLNAIRHGSSAEGFLTVRLRCSPHDVLAISVEDQGAQLILTGAPSNDVERKPFRTGNGLMIVKGMVQRELKGRFGFDSHPTCEDQASGTVATVELPLLEDEKFREE